MKNMEGFTVRCSSKAENQFYIDYSGSHRISDISRLTGIEDNRIEEIYRLYGARLDKENGLYYFPSRKYADNALGKLGEYMGKGSGKLVFLTFEEMEYIRQTLINEGKNIINVKNDLKWGIFNKFNS